MISYDTESLDADENGRLIKSIVTPRPIGWISTTSVNGTDNLAPYSCYNYVNQAPPALMFRSGGGEGNSPKDSARNAIKTGEFVVNTVTESLAEQMDKTSKSLPPDESEFEFAGIKQAESVVVDPPRVAHAVAALECSLYDSLKVYDSHIVIGTVEYFHISEEIMENGEIQMERIKSVGRLGGPYYTSVNALELQRDYS